MHRENGPAGKERRFHKPRSGGTCTTARSRGGLGAPSTPSTPHCLHLGLDLSLQHGDDQPQCCVTGETDTTGVRLRL